jgi:putative solute:sodium symporter small subunit
MGGVKIMSDPKQSLTERQKTYWKKNTALIRNLLVIWALVSLVGAIILGGPLSGVPFFGITLSFWLAQQGSILVFVCLIFYYAIRMDQLDKEYLQDANVSSSNNSSSIGGSV